MAMRVLGIKEGNGKGGKSNGDGDEGGRQATAMRAMVSRVASKQWQQGPWQRQQGWWATKRERATAARAMVMTMRVVVDKEGKGGKVMAMATRVAGKQTATATKRVMAMKTREAGKEEGNGKGGKSDGDGKDDGCGKQ